MTGETLMTPGGADAVAVGCTCPVVANNEGRRPPVGTNLWWVEQACPVHKSWWEAARRRKRNVRVDDDGG